MDCPKCPVGKLNEVSIRVNTQFRAKVLQGESKLYTLKLDQCFVCNGVWFDAGELEKYLAEDLSIVDSHVVDQKLVEEWDLKVGRCPRCAVDMVKKQGMKGSTIAVDFCEKCQGTWVDMGELDRLEDKDLNGKKRFLLLLEEILSKVFGKDKER